jgi:4-alpha-glucanotransferase
VTGPVTLRRRASGVLLHPTSLPGPHGVGDLGTGAGRFAEFLRRAGQRWWQMLPLGPVGLGNSPYNALSAFAGNPQLLSLEALARDGLLEPVDLHRDPPLPADRVDYPATVRFKEARLRKAVATFERRGRAEDSAAFERFRQAEAPWLPDFALFRALKDAHGGGPWTDWPMDLRLRRPAALAAAARELRDEVHYHEVLQHFFARQWAALRDHTRALGIGLMGDIPIYVAPDSADVWANPDLFRLGADGQPEAVAGVPPDYFSETGQRWGNPLYRWDVMRARGYRWWIERFRVTFARCDAVRLDHFIGFVRFWEVPAELPDARGGYWRPGPGAELFDAVTAALGRLELVVEDLGSVTPEVTALRDRLGVPGMHVLQFVLGTALEADAAPDRYSRQSVVYTGTHDNDTTQGWFMTGGLDPATASPEEIEERRQTILRQLGSDGREVHWDMIRLALSTPSSLTIIPMQDLLGLGSEARMNRPASTPGNWEWRLADRALTPALAERLLGLTQAYDRA